MSKNKERGDLETDGETLGLETAVARTGLGGPWTAAAPGPLLPACGVVTFPAHFPLSHQMLPAEKSTAVPSVSISTAIVRIENLFLQRNTFCGK